MPLDLEEQEKLAELKAWWKQYGTMIMTVLLAAAVGFAGWSSWQVYKRNQAGKASAVYEALSKAIQENDAKAVREASGTLVESFPGTHYAAMGALLAARHHVDRGDSKSAKAQLQWVIDGAPSQDLRDLARLRLGAVLLDEDAHEEALKIAEGPRGAAYDAQFAALRGDVLVAKNQLAEAKAAYKAALEKAGTEQRAFAESVRMRLEGLGG
jgi:predicted negative regulator of RcsB-dependent stress response